MRNAFLRISFVLFSCFFLVACVANQETNNHQDQENKQDHDQTSNEKMDNNHDNQEKADEHNKHTDQKKEKQSEEATNPDNTISDELKMKTTYIKWPRHFPDDTIKTEIEENEAKHYQLSFHNQSDQQIASFSARLYDDPGRAKDSMEEFMDGKKVMENSTTEEKLGHGLKGYGEGAAGHAYFSWQEGRWLLSIQSATEDDMNNPAIAKKMVDYLEAASLPAPKEDGIVYVDYPYGGQEVKVDIRWQEEDVIYQLQTDQVPLDALKMVVSTKGK